MEELAKAYNNVFLGNATKAEAQMVLADLLNESGFNMVYVPGRNVSLEFEQGKRYLYARIHRFLTMTQEEWNDLQIAARQEAVIDSQEGHIT